MSALTYEGLHALLARYIGPLDDADPKVRKRLHILRTAAELFARQGYRKTSVDEVARAAGVAKGTVYSYFDGKIDLLVAAAAMEKREALGFMAEVLDPERPAEQRLRRYLEAILVMPLRMPVSTALMTGDQELAAVMAELPPELTDQGVADRIAFLVELIDEVARPHTWTESELRDRADVLTGLVFLSPHLQAPHVRGQVSVERYAELLADLLIAGLRNDKGNEP
ncbi:MAG: TetR/AcrR family transcriptional regulator [Myxococcales bacterium]|nr:TetR/AcrR family transcriptional regulator [Myxococcales bacterium]MCB9717341.1 TetR/AcrR family transcriptional regulator [Myxococcales bacterium]